MSAATKVSASDYANFTITDFDQYNCLKLPLSLYLIVAFILRAYVIWLMSLSNMRDHSSFLQWVYPQQQSFHLGLASGAVGIFIALIIALRKPDAKSWVKTSWQHGRFLILLALIFDLVVNLYAFIFYKFSTTLMMLAHGLIVAFIWLFLYQNKKMRLIFNEFPQSFPEDKPKKLKL